MSTEERPALRATSVTVMAPDPRLLAGFYARLLGVKVSTSDPPRPDEPETGGFAQVRMPHLTLNFEYEQQWAQPVWPARAGQQSATQHLDIWVEDLVAASAWAVTCGATLAETQPQDDVRVHFDPAGHPFCLFL
jgi:catechol 2,3-dioxygenase-like lactoylglutathione lyase family enzyme